VITIHTAKTRTRAASGVSLDAGETGESTQKAAVSETRDDIHTNGDASTDPRAARQRAKNKRGALRPLFIFSAPVNVSTSSGFER
jgi:hypothetical protein